VALASWCACPRQKRRRGPARSGERRHDPFQQLECAVEHRIVTPVLDDAAGVRNSRTVTREKEADVCEAQAAGDMRQIHGDLARERDGGLAPRRSKKFRVLDAENLRNRTFDSRFEVPVPFVAA
jgi:hypothetical protein